MIHPVNRFAISLFYNIRLTSLRNEQLLQPCARRASHFSRILGIGSKAGKLTTDYTDAKDEHCLDSKTGEADPLVGRVPTPGTFALVPKPWGSGAATENSEITEGHCFGSDLQKETKATKSLPQV